MKLGVSVFNDPADFIGRRYFHKWIILDLNLHKNALNLLNIFTVILFWRIGHGPFAWLNLLFPLLMIKIDQGVWAAGLAKLLEKVFRAEIQEKSVYIVIILRYRVLLK
jgi:hypothetical protein